MSNIIECPACATRYKMNKAIPEGGRSVKCARCGNQWRLEADEPADELIELDEGEENNVVAAQHDYAAPSGHSPAEQHDASDNFFHAASNGEEWTDPHVSAEDENPAEDHHATRRSTYEETDESGFAPIQHWRNENDDNSAEADDYSFRGEHLKAGFETEGDTEFYGSRTQGIFNNEDSDEPDGSATGEIERAAAGEDRHWSPQMLSQSLTRDPLFDDDDTDEDAEMAVRSVLKGALANPREAHGGDTAFDNGEARQNDEDDDDTWQQFASQDSGDLNKADFEVNGEALEQDDEFNASIAAIAADRRLYSEASADDHDEFGEDRLEDSEPDRRTSHSAYAYDEAAFEDEVEDAFRARSMPNTSGERIAGDLRPDDIDDDGADYKHRAKLDASQDDFDANYFDDEAASLQSQLEEGSLTHIERPDSSGGGGGLAIAAAWAVFFSIISGIALGLVSFRSEIVTALPGMGALYQTVGFNIAPSNVDFSNVSYRWTVEEGKPMIEVTGKLVNLTDKQIPVPRVLVNVRNAESDDGTQTTATVRTEPLEPREIADFTLEFLAPPTTISQIELELDRQ